MEPANKEHQKEDLEGGSIVSQFKQLSTSQAENLRNAESRFSASDQSSVSWRKKKGERYNDEVKSYALKKFKETNN